MFGKTFKNCRSGNVAILFALAIVPAVSLVGLGVDYTRAQNVRTLLNSAVDSAALALAHSSVNLSPADLQAKANQLFKASFQTDPDVSPGPVKVVRSTAGLTINASADISTAFMKIMSVKTLHVEGTSKVVWGGTNVEVVLALDNTGSMAGNKLKELKKAATELIDTLEETAHTPGSVKIGLVPFATTVRVEPDAHKNQEWIHFPSRLVERDNNNDNEHGRNRNDNDDNGRRRGNERWETVPFDKSKWDGCIQDRDQDYDVGDASYSKGSVGSLYPAIQECPSQEKHLTTVQPLTSDFGKLRTAVSRMNAAGNTNVTIGIAWGLSLLSSKAPYTQGSAETGRGKTQKYLIVLTDGENTQNRFSDKTSDIDARTKLACASARSAGTVFTIRVIEGDARLLQACASDTSNYYDVSNAGQMTPVFRSIANEIAQLRIAH